MALSKNNPRKALKPLAIAAMLASGLIHPFLLPAFAAPGAQISNTATATYEDANGNPFDTESNTVTVTVTEVAGITLTPVNVSSNSGSFEVGDELEYEFTATNVGNDTTDVQLPEISNIATENFTISEVRIVDSTGTVIGTYDTAATGTQLLSGIAGGKILNAGEFVTIIIVGNITGTNLNPGTPVRVTLGDTGPNDGGVDTQNQPVNLINNPDRNVQTVDDPTEGNGNLDPADEREASATNDVGVGTAQRPLALARILKTDVEPVNAGATNAANDDEITYNLTLQVSNNSPVGSLIPAALIGTDITLNGSTQNRILISDAIPENTELKEIPTVTDTSWTVVYSTSNAATTSPVISGANPAAEWVNAATFAGNLSDVERIGFVYDATTAGDEIDPNEEVSGFSYTVITAGLPATGGRIANLAQVFGRTYDDPAEPVNPVDQIIYDESGDPNANNFDGVTPPDADGSDFDPATDTGVVDPDTLLDADSDDGSNTGVGLDGEPNLVVLVGEELSGTDNILNGPVGRPDAVGPNHDDDDFTSGGADIDDIATAPVVINYVNTVSNPGAGATPSAIFNVTVEPVSPSEAETASDTGVAPQFGTNADIPNGTTVTISDGGTQSATYTWNQAGGTWGTTDNPVNLGVININSQKDYNVTVTLPAGAAVTDGDVIPISLIAFPDTDLDGYVAESINNITIDRIIAGEFLTLTKEVQIRDDSGNIIQPWTDDNAALADAELLSGYIVEYRITYENNTAVAPGSGNVPLTATNVEIIEDGDATGVGSADNNWHNDTAANSLTEHMAGTSFSAGTVEYFDEYADGPDNSLGNSDPADGSTVEAYVNRVGDVAPGNSGTFMIRRRVK